MKKEEDNKKQKYKGFQWFLMLPLIPLIIFSVLMAGGKCESTTENWIILVTSCVSSFATIILGLLVYFQTKNYRENDEQKEDGSEGDDNENDKQTKNETPEEKPSEETKGEQNEPKEEQIKEEPVKEEPAKKPEKEQKEKPKKEKPEKNEAPKPDDDGNVAL